MGHAKAAVQPGDSTPNDKNEQIVSAKDLPLHCPTPEMRLWDSHPRVYIDMANGKGKCPYCGTDFILE
ncbi:MAG: zinc-finger domain-containing protein [Methylococcales bacterium]|jgi:uncharacterized Zn-finger protein|nr:zinc-finger domain-containing protein [Methylococcales bacterium]MBT7444738.1 zinc-finger domain-containing protein [Methylococcales bacterium]